MLDLEGTSEDIDDLKAKKFMEQLEFLRNKCGADYGIISISTHYRTGIVMNDVLEVLERNLSSNMRLGLNFFYGGTYDYKEGFDIMRHPEFNKNKTETFTSFYNDSCWIAIIDDGIDADTYKKYQDKKAMLFCRPSQEEEDLSENNFMSIGTETRGFAGVLEVLDQYIESVKNLDFWKMSEKQKAMITHVSGLELINKIRKKDYYFIKRYFSGGYASDDDYRIAFDWLVTYNKEEISDELLELLDLIIEKSGLEDKEEVLKKIKFKKVKSGDY